ncbi:MAG: trimethylamine methyltransferase family protein [Chloroflexota bacterium]
MTHLSVLTAEEVERLHQATLRILSETGIVLNHPEGRALILEAGGRLRPGDPGAPGAGGRQERVLLPPDLVEWAIQAAGKKVCLRGRGGVTKVLGGDPGEPRELHWHNLGGARDIYDHRSGRRRTAMAQDVIDSTRLLDALDGPTTITPFFTPTDVPGELMSLAMYRHALPNTVKPLQGPGVQTAREVAYALRMAEVIGPPPEVVTLSVSPVSPLIFPSDGVGAILAIARAGVAFAPLPCPTAGTTAPLSIAGAVAQQNAEVLASLVLAELARPGLPVVYCGRLAMMEPRTGFSVWGGVELGLASAGTVQIARRYGLPVNVYGFSTNAHTLDLQSGYERALNAVIPALAGADELSGIGEMEAGVMGSYAQIVADCEMAHSVRRIQHGFSADADALAVEVIATAMAEEHNFLTQRHTSRYLRSGEVLLTKLAERGPWDSWEQKGRQGMAERAQAEAERILANHSVAPLEAAQERALDEILAAAAEELVQHA